MNTYEFYLYSGKVVIIRAANPNLAIKVARERGSKFQSFTRTG